MTAPTTLHAQLLQKIKEARERYAQKWEQGRDEANPEMIVVGLDPQQSFEYVDVIVGTQEREDDIFDQILSARTLLPALLAEVEKQVGEHEPSYGMCDACSSDINHVKAEDCWVVRAWAEVFGLAPMEEK